VKFKLYIIIAYFLVLCEIDAFSQYVQFSQFYAAPTALAPSFTGMTTKSRINAIYRDQWAKLKGVFVTYALGYDFHVSKINSGFGVLLINDEAGQGNLRRTEFGVLYSWYGLLDNTYKIYFRPGVEFKLTQRSVDIQKLIFPSHIKPDGTLIENPVYPQPADINKLNVDATASVLFYSPVFWIGLTIDHLFRPSDGFYDPTYKVPLKYSFYGGYKWKMSKRSRGSSSAEDWFFVSYHYRLMALSDQLDIGGYWEHDPFVLGVWVRGMPYLNIDKSKGVDAVIFLAGYKILNFKIGYSYDLPVNTLLTTAGGTHEISLTYTFAPLLRGKKRYAPIPCPKL